MAKQPKKQVKKSIPATPIQTEVPIPAPGAVGMGMKYFPYIITTVFFILSLMGILHHELWRDEYQAWMVAADAHSIPELFRNLKYEGNPVLWHAFLFIITAFTDDPFWMQLFHILISASFIFLFNRYAPNSILEKVLFSFGYFAFFEYNLISRSYGLGLLLIVIFLALYRNKKKNILLMAGVLFLLSNNTIFGVILTLCFAGIVFSEEFFRNKKSKIPRIPISQLGLFGLITLSGVILGYLQIRPEPDNSFPMLYVTQFEMERAKWAFSRLFHGYFPIPNFTTLHFWNTNFFVGDESKFRIGYSIVLFLAWVVAFMRYRIIVVTYVIGTMILLIFYYYTGLIWSRYSGHLFLLFISCYWLIHYQKEKAFKNGLLNRLSLLGNRIRKPLFILVLAAHFCGGIIAYYLDMKYPFSTSSNAAAYIRQHKLTEFDIIGSVDYIISPLASQLDKKILYAERKEYGTFIIFDQKRTGIWSFSELQSFVGEMLDEENERIILVKSTEIRRTFNDTGQSEPWTRGFLNDTMSLQFLTKIEPGIVADEQYFIYAVDKVK